MLFTRDNEFVSDTSSNCQCVYVARVVHVYTGNYDGAKLHHIFGSVLRLLRRGFVKAPG